MIISGMEKKKLLSLHPRIQDVMPSLVAQSKLPKAIYKETAAVIALARKFTREVVEPNFQEIEAKVEQDNDYLPWEFIHEANRWRLFSRWIPKMFGGEGLNFISLYPFLEEVATVCNGLANIIGVHYLGVGTLCASWNVKLMSEIWRQVKAGQETGQPCLLSLAITEPSAGTDVEEPLLLDKARVQTTAQKVEGGYLVNGRKVFISNGHVSTWHMLICYEDTQRPVETQVMLAVHNDFKGFSFGVKEKKMGQKACVASELIFEDCFVPADYVCSSPDQMKKLKRSTREINQMMVDFVVSSSRTGVGAFATGAARGAYETALAYAGKKKVSGELLINHQWAQVILAEMYKNVNTCRAVYMESAYANAISGMFKLLFKKPIFYLNKYLPTRFIAAAMAPWLKLDLTTWLFRKYYYDWYKIEEAEATSGWASLAKFSCSDLGLVNSNMTLDLMGSDGLRRDHGAEKYFRDAKLMQIYEGTNQLNRLNLFKNLIGRNKPEVKIFQ